MKLDDWEQTNNYDDKTKIILIGTKQQFEKVKTVSMNNSALEFLMRISLPSSMIARRVIPDVLILLWCDLLCFY